MLQPNIMRSRNTDMVEFSFNQSKMFRNRIKMASYIRLDDRNEWCVCLVLNQMGRSVSRVIYWGKQKLDSFTHASISQESRTNIGKPSFRLHPSIAPTPLQFLYKCFRLQVYRFFNCLYTFFSVDERRCTAQVCHYFYLHHIMPMSFLNLNHPPAPRRISGIRISISTEGKAHCDEL